MAKERQCFTDIKKLEDKKERIRALKSYLARMGNQGVDTKVVRKARRHLDLLTNPTETAKQKPLEKVSQKSTKSAEKFSRERKRSRKGKRVKNNG
jgi:hypothetical protein